MDANFNDFLQGEIFAPHSDEPMDIEDAPKEEESRKYSTGGVKLDSNFECHSTHRVPTLFQTALFSVVKLVNDLASKEDHADQLPTLFAYMKELPEHAKKAILPQLTFTALRKYHGDEIWAMMAHPTKETLPILLSCMKQEEDMMRYLYEFAPENEYLVENQDKILLDVFDEVPSKCLVTSKLDCAPDTIICGFEYSKEKKPNLTSSDDEYWMQPDDSDVLGPVVDQETFKKNWKEFTYGLLDDLDWSNCFAAGGSVLASLRKLPGYLNNSASDIDLYLFGLDKEGAKQKLQHIWDTLQRKIGDRKLHALKTKNTFTFFADLPFRPIQVITGLYKSPSEVLCSFDLDCITVGYNGSHVLALPRFVLSMSTALNFLDSDMNLSNKLQYTRLSKYDERGFSTCLPYTLRNHALGGFDCDLPEDPRVEELTSNVHKLVELMSLAKIVLLSRTLYRFSFNRLVSKVTAWNLRWQKGISVGRTRWSLLENDALKRAGETSVSKEYAKLRDLALLTVDELRKFWAEAPRYESVAIELNDNQWGNAQYHLEKFKQFFPVASSAQEFKPILSDTKFSTYASSMLQCFYLDIIVPCENSAKVTIREEAIKSSSPLRYINTSLSRLDYEFFSVDVKFTGLDALWKNKAFEIISEPVQAGKHSWRVKLDSKKGQHVVWVSLILEENELTGLYNNESIMKHCFSNFVLSLVSTSNKQADNINLDGSYIFTHGSKHNSWTTFILKNYLVPAEKRETVRGLVDEEDLPHIQEYLPDNSVFIDKQGILNMKLHLQYLTPNVNVVAL